MPTVKKVWTYLVIVFLALGAAVNYEIFVFPNQFAPSGLNGICTMIQYVTGISVGYLSLLINVPLALWCYFEVSKPMATRSMVYVIIFSIGILILDKMDLSFLHYATENGTSKILGPLVAGVIQGYIYSILMKASAYTGGTDFIASLIHKYRPDMNFFFIGFSLNVVVAAISFFVYGYKIEPVLLCILYSFATSTVSDKVNKTGRSAVRFEIITDDPEEISKSIIERLHHSATLLPGKGMYRGKEVNLLICVVNRTQAAALSAIIRDHPRSFAVMSPVSEVMGNFKHIDSNGNIEKPFLDQGDGTGI